MQWTWHEVNADLVQARESAVAVKALQDEIENKFKQYFYASKERKRSKSKNH